MFLATPAQPINGMLTRNVDYTLYGAEQHMPDCMQLVCKPSDDIATQAHVFRTPGQCDHDFWIKVMSVAMEIIGVRPKRGSHVSFFCKYQTHLTPDTAQAFDDMVNYRRLLSHLMRYAPTQQERFQAAMRASELLWPAARGTVQ